mmetsp:Transcript_2241/g.3053  ORF Transcript_2241/g.3053 Transcript_2241/m.3053 type:complete len:165 (+) Transcript_2241:51-545(+)
MFAFDSHIEVDFSSTSTNYLKVFLKGHTKKQLRKLVQAISTVKTKLYNNSMRAMEDFLDSGVMNSWPNAIRTYSAAVTINERQEVAKATLNVVAYIACYGTVIRNRLINVPDLFASLADLCKEEVLLQLLQGNYQMLSNIKSMVRSLTDDSNALMEANWAAFSY